MYARWIRTRRSDFTHAHLDDRAGAVFRTAWYAVLRIPSHYRVDDAQAHCGSRHVSTWTRRGDTRLAHLSQPAIAANRAHQDRTIVGKSAARLPAGVYRASSCADAPVWRDSFA